MFNIDFYNFIKDENSTKRPTGSPATYPCEIKRSSGLVSPTIELNIGLTTAPAWNYCYIADFNRYYFIDEWTFELGFWTASLSCDALATYRTEIGNADVYALRSSAVYDGRIPDTLYPTKEGCSFSSVAIDRLWNPLTGSIFDGTYVVGVVTPDSDYGSIRYYLLGLGTLRRMNNYLLDDALLLNNGFSIQDAEFALQKSLVDPMQFIKSCVYIPLNLDQIGNDHINGADLMVFDWPIITLGTEPDYVAALKPETPSLTFTRTINIPKHPQTATRGNYVNLTPFTNLFLNIPPFGVIELDTTVTSNASTLTLEVTIDIPTGLGIMDVKCNGVVLNTVSAQIGIPVQLSQVTRDYLGGVTSAIGGITGTLANSLSGNIGGAIMSATSGISSAVNSMKPRLSSTGIGGSYSQLYSDDPALYSQFFELVDDDIAKNGRPCCKIVNCKNNPGYYLIQDGDIPMGGTHSEAQIVKGYLESGFYWE